MRRFHGMDFTSVTLRRAVLSDKVRRFEVVYEQKSVTGAPHGTSQRVTSPYGVARHPYGIHSATAR